MKCIWITVSWEAILILTKNNKKHKDNWKGKMKMK